jgi:hypothetical protein
MRKTTMGTGFRKVPRGKGIRIRAAGGGQQLVKLTAMTGRKDNDGDE